MGCRIKCFAMFYVFSFLPGVYVGTLNLIASIPGSSVLTFLDITIARLFVSETEIFEKTIVN